MPHRIYHLERVQVGKLEAALDVYVEQPEPDPQGRDEVRLELQKAAERLYDEGKLEAAAMLAKLLERSG